MNCRRERNHSSHSVQQPAQPARREKKDQRVRLDLWASEASEAKLVFRARPVRLAGKVCLDCPEILAGQALRALPDSGVHPVQKV